MFIFVGSVQTLAIPESQIVNIQANGSLIEINYLIGHPEAHEQTFTVKYNSETEAQTEMKAFYAACREGQNAYFFGKLGTFINA